MFNEDAKLVSKELDLTLTTGTGARTRRTRPPCAACPYHSAEAYIARLVAKGYKVAICEQTEDPATAKGLVDRDIVRIVTPRHRHRELYAGREPQQLHGQPLRPGRGLWSVLLRPVHRRVLCHRSPGA